MDVCGRSGNTEEGFPLSSAFAVSWSGTHRTESNVGRRESYRDSLELRRFTEDLQTGVVRARAWLYHAVYTVFRLNSPLSWILPGVDPTQPRPSASVRRLVMSLDRGAQGQSPPCPWHRREPPSSDTHRSRMASDYYKPTHGWEGR